MAKGLIMLNMSHRFDWEKGFLNRNYHVFQKIRERKLYDVILSVDFLPFTFKKVLKVLIKGQPWQRQATTLYQKWNVRVDHDPTDHSLFFMTAVNLHRLKEILSFLKFPVEDLTIWSYNPLAAPLFADFPRSFIIFDAVDNWIEHPSYTNQKAYLTECYKQIQKRADVIFTVSEGLVDFFGKQQNVFYIPNGVDPDHFQHATCHPRWIKEKQPFQEVVGYHGIIQSRVNLSIIDYLAQKYPKMLFLIAGPVWKEMRKTVRKLQKYSHVRFVGPLSYHDLPQFIACCDVAIIPHRIDTFTQSMNPLKIYEYLAAGKPIVTSPLPACDQFQDLVLLAVSPEDFAREIERARQEDSAELRSRRMHMAKSHSWKQRVQLMFDIIEKMKPDGRKPVES